MPMRRCISSSSPRLRPIPMWHISSSSPRLLPPRQTMDHARRAAQWTAHRVRWRTGNRRPLGQGALIPPFVRRAAVHWLQPDGLSVRQRTLPTPKPPSVLRPYKRKEPWRIVPLPLLHRPWLPYPCRLILRSINEVQKRQQPKSDLRTIPPRMLSPPLRPPHRPPRSLHLPTLRLRRPVCFL